MAGGQEVAEASAVVTLINNSGYIQSSQVAGLAEANESIAEATSVLVSGRIVNLEQIMCIGLSLIPSDPIKGKSLLREVDTSLASKADGVQEDSVQTTLRKASTAALESTTS